ncbi:hypothetical protein [Halanaerobacter jeridensis]|uniref:Uncharacterized protein n=1 Tax=Halanaerobacter jeridensis TaxID=706427 RepID=A0A938XT69_9FIRM|nr:hypothetical protein [Halanaerobacter jeridensis]MBM7557073.1 hypothetical protein [Halanaerobacter jeridensis]
MTSSNESTHILNYDADDTNGIRGNFVDVRIAVNDESTNVNAGIIDIDSIDIIFNEGVSSANQNDVKMEGYK